jgi:hypothetical protein
VQAELAAPERFVAECVEAEDLLPLGEQSVARCDVLSVGARPVEGLDGSDDCDPERVQDQAAYEKRRRGEKQSLRTGHTGHRS